jgi:hypothetical protein
MAKKKHAVRKKYVNPIEQQRQQEAQYKKFFFDKLRNLCKQIGDVSLYHLIPLIDKLLLYRLRGAPLKVVAAQGTKTQKRLMDALAKIIKSQQLLMKLEVVKDSGQMMTFADYSLVGRALESYILTTDTDFPGKEQFTKYAKLREERECVCGESLEAICSSACWVFDDIRKAYLHTYHFETYLPASSGIQAPQEGPPSLDKEWKAYIEQDFRTHEKITIGTYPLEVRKVKIDGEIHPAIQTGMLYYEASKPKLHSFTLSLEDLHMNSPFSKLGLPIYIQQHALDRMKERIGFVIPAFYNALLVEALMHKEFVPIAKNRMLIACFTAELKIGYFVAELVEGIILIRTFLLLTNSGTPEGNKLAQLTGLQTDDRKYLAIDTLQGLANSDIEQNEAFCNLLRTAGCNSILELCKKINSEPGMMWLLDKSQPKNIISDLITEYLKPNTDGEEYVS